MALYERLKMADYIDRSMKIPLLQESWTVFHLLLMVAICSVLNCFSLMEEYKKTVFASLQVHDSRVVIVTTTIYGVSTLGWVLYTYTFSLILASSMQRSSYGPLSLI